jgi:hypothetical protein
LSAGTAVIEGEVRAANTPSRLKPHRTWTAVTTLYVLAALIPESIATSNTSVLSYVAKPITLPFLAAFYGGSAVAIRELWLRRGLRWRGVVLLGIAFGFGNEGVIAATWYEVAPIGYVFTRGSPGVDVAWAAFLTIFHVVFSMIIPILLVQLMFPGIAGQRWVGRIGLAVSASLPLLLLTLALLSSTYRQERLVAFIATGLLIVVGLRQRRTRVISAFASTIPVRPHPYTLDGAGDSPRLPGVRRLRVVGAVLTVSFFAAGFLVPGIVAHVASRHLAEYQIGYVMVMLVVVGAGTLVVRRWSRRDGWGPRHLVAIITGLLLPAMVLTTANPAAFLAGAAVFSGPFIVLLVWLARKYRPRTCVSGSDARC